jgi:hypothetical protein
MEYETFGESGLAVENKDLRRMMETKAKLLDAAYKDVVSPLAELWFDSSIFPRRSCYMCERGTSGSLTNSDGHDADCIISRAYSLYRLIAVSNERG